MTDASDLRCSLVLAKRSRQQNLNILRITDLAASRLTRVMVRPVCTDVVLAVVSAWKIPATEICFALGVGKNLSTFLYTITRQDQPVDGGWWSKKTPAFSLGGGDS